ncbi:MAG: hypothetical protein JST86_02445 [Bacteroidetes bacterium]|nr:hypothetical protein [Bacteroidota bacterium]
MMQQDIINDINYTLSLSLPQHINEEAVRNLLAGHINELVKNNFEQLVTILYRVDINEDRLKSLLKNNPGEDAGKIIAGLILERLLQKAAYRKQFSAKPSDEDNEEKW